MSYEGREEFLCIQGHYQVIDCWDYIPHCQICQGLLVYRHAIDDTNGEEPSDTGTFPAAKEPQGFEDHWKRDHYGNRYAVKIPLFAVPEKDSVWRNWSGDSDG